MQNFLASNWGLVGKEWGVADKHFEEDDTDWPPVYRFIIATLPKNLRSNIVWGANCAVGKLPAASVAEFFVEHWLELIKIDTEVVSVDSREGWRSNLGMLAEAKVCEFDVAVLVQQNVVWFQVSVDVVVLVYWLNGQNQLSNVESRVFLGKNVLAHEQSH